MNRRFSQSKENVTRRKLVGQKNNKNKKNICFFILSFNNISFFFYLYIFLKKSKSFLEKIPII